MGNVVEGSRRFYEQRVAPMIRSSFPEYENKIAAGLVGEGSDCFGYDDFISRDHDFGTGVCLWLTDEDYREIGQRLSEEYERLVDSVEGNGLTARLRSRRGVMTIHGFYSSILGIDLDTESGSISEEDWNSLDHNCLATAVNGVVFRDDLGQFSRFRKRLLDYYPDKIWKERIVNALHKFSAAMQVNYARCMSRGDYVAARLCHMEGLQSAMELFFLMKRQYPPYYKWTFRRLSELDKDGRYARLISTFADATGDKSVWAGKNYSPTYINLSDPIVLYAERLAEQIVAMLRENGLTEGIDPYLEKYVDEILEDM
ncbi:MAG: DUF4037 domain-containing protein [Eubacterium sp.]|nr:DUF4037 domain-containing protein [Eubacterium sp.]